MRYGPAEGAALAENLEMSLDGDDQDSKRMQPRNQARRSRFARDMAIEEFGFRTWRLGVLP